MHFLIAISTSQSVYTSCRDVYAAVNAVDKASLINTKSYHYIQREQGNIEQVLCAFISINATAMYIGNLFESFSLSYGAFNSTLSTQAMFDDFAVNEQNISTIDESYRWNKDRILNMHEFDETYLLMTCNFDISMNKDYVFTKFYDEFLWDSDIATDNSCFKVESANIRGYQCDDKSVNFWSLSEAMHFRIDSHFCDCECCEWNNGSVASEDNFGFYSSINANFSCSETEDSTTNYWIGEVIHHQTCQEIYTTSNQSLSNISNYTSLDQDGNHRELMCSFIRLKDNTTFIGTLVCYL